MQNSTTHFDYLVIGAGSGGIASGRWTGKNFNKKVGIIEHQRLGGNKLLNLILIFLTSTNHN